VRSLALWGGIEEMRIDIEEHRRRGPLRGIDLSRTVGPLAWTYPVLLEGGTEGWPDETLRRTRDRLRQTPGRGLGHGLLRAREGGEKGSELHAQGSAELVFGYLGELAMPALESPLLEPAGRSFGLFWDSGSGTSYPLELRTAVVAHRLRMEWRFDPARFSLSQVEILAREVTAALCQLISWYRSGDMKLTPVDFPDAGLSQAELDDVLAEIGEAEEGDLDG